MSAARPPGGGTPSHPSSGLRVLVVEDTATVAELVRHSLETAGMDVDVEGDLAGARRRLGADSPDVVVLDVELPDGSGLDLLRDGTVGGAVPVVVLSSREEELDRVLGLELGADDYMVKPFFPRELATRVRRAADRANVGVPPTRLEFGELVIDAASREVIVGGTLVSLTDREFEVLAHLASSPRQVFDRTELLRDVWRSSPEWQSPKTVTEHIRRIRRKIDPDPDRPRWVVTVGRAGYRFEPDG